MIRSGQVIAAGAITSLKRHKLDVNQVGQGTECGLVLDHGQFSDWQAGDVIECVATVRKRADDVAGPGSVPSSSDSSSNGRDEKIAAYGL